MKYTILFSLFISATLWGQMINHNLSALFVTPAVKDACDQKLQEKIKQLIAKYDETSRIEVEDILKHHANLAYHRLSYNFLRLKEKYPRENDVTNEFNALTDLLGGGDKAKVTIDSLDTFNDYIYNQQNVGQKEEIKEQFDNIFDGLMKFSQDHHQDNPQQAHLILQPGDKNLLLNMIATKAGNRNNLFEHLTTSMNMVLSQRGQSITADADIQARFIDYTQNQLAVKPKEKINDFIAYMKSELTKFAEDPALEYYCKQRIGNLLKNSPDSVGCIDCENFRNILTPESEDLLSNVFSLLNQEFPVDTPASLRVQGPRFSGCKIENKNGVKTLILLNVTDVPTDRGDDTRNGSTFWIDNCPKGQFGSSATDESCQSYRESSSIKFRSPAHIFHNPEGRSSFESLSFPMLNATENTLYIRNDWTSSFERPIDLTTCENVVPAPIEKTCQELNQFFKETNTDYDDSYSTFLQMIGDKKASKEECETAKLKLKRQIQEGIAGGTYQGKVQGLDFTTENIDTIMTNCQISCVNYQKSNFTCSDLPLIKDFFAVQSTLTPASCQEQVSAITQYDYSAYINKTIADNALPADPTEARSKIIEICKINCEGIIDPCEIIKNTPITDEEAGTTTPIKDLSPDKIKAYFEANWSATAYPQFENAAKLIESCFSEETTVTPTDSPCDDLQEELDAYSEDQKLEKRINLCEEKLKEMNETHPACELECKELTCDDYEKHFKENYISVGDEEELTDDACDEAIEEIKSDFEDNSLAKSCDYSCKSDDDDDKDSSSKKKQYKNETVPQHMLQNLMQPAPVPAKSKRIRGGNRG